MTEKCLNDNFPKLFPNGTSKIIFQIHIFSCFKNRNIIPFNRASINRIWYLYPYDVRNVIINTYIILYLIVNMDLLHNNFHRSSIEADYSRYTAPQPRPQTSRYHTVVTFEWYKGGSLIGTNMMPRGVCCTVVADHPRRRC